MKATIVKEKLLPQDWLPEQEFGHESSHYEICQSDIRNSVMLLESALQKRLAINVGDGFEDVKLPILQGLANEDGLG